VLNHEAAVCEWLLRRFRPHTINWAAIIIFCTSSAGSWAAIGTACEAALVGRLCRSESARLWCSAVNGSGLLAWHASAAQASAILTWRNPGVSERDLPKSGSQRIKKTARSGIHLPGGSLTKADTTPHHFSVVPGVPRSSERGRLVHRSRRQACDASGAWAAIS
jgi:hypothetical protein